jgi:hypothetical protein
MATITAAAESGTPAGANARRIPLSVIDVCLISFGYLASFFYVSGFPHQVMAFPLDDSWIHQVVARNLARFGTLGFIPGKWSSGTTSLLWTVILSANWKFLPAVNPVTYTCVVNALFLIAIGLGLLMIGRRDGLPKESCWILALTPALDGNFIWFGLTGMEQVLFVALSVLGIFLWFEKGLKSTILSSLCLGALALTRPEGLMLAVLLAVTYKLARRNHRDVFILSLIVVPCAALFLTASLLTSHSWLPMTYAGRRWLYFGNDKITTTARLLFLSRLALGVLMSFHPREAILLLIPIAITSSTIGIIAIASGKWRRVELLYIWGTALLCAYLVILPSYQDGYRYQPLFVLLSLPLLLIGADALLREIFKSERLQRARNLLLPAILLLLALACGVRSLSFWRKINADAIEVVETTHAPMGRYIIASIPPNAKVAAFDIGRMGYLDSGRIVDISGLVDKSFLPYLRDNQMMSYLRNRKVLYFVWPSRIDGSSDIPRILTITPELQQEVNEVKIFCAPQTAWSISHRITVNHARCQVLYRLNR